MLWNPTVGGNAASPCTLCFCSVRIRWWKDFKVLVAPSNTSNIWSGGTAGKILILELNWTKSIDQGIDTSTKCGSANWRSAAVDWSHRARWKNADTRRHIDKLSIDVLKEFQTLQSAVQFCSFWEFIINRFLVVVEKEQNKSKGG